MRTVDIITSKRDGYELSDRQIRYFVENYTNGGIPDEQAAALMMAIYFRGMTPHETATLTLAMAESGDMIDLSQLEGVKVDKHSTGGIGDKTSLIVCPIASAAGVPVIKMSGRALGYTGGTVDKLESIPGFRTALTVDEMMSITRACGICIAGQSSDLAPADKKLYALRDVTGTVSSIPLIAASIMSKKIAAGADAIVLDVKYGSGAFMKTKEDAAALAGAMCSIGELVGRRTVAVLNSMDQPLGLCSGNSIEVIEAIGALKGRAPEDLMEHCISLSARMIELGLNVSEKEAEKIAKEQIRNGKALKKLAAMVEAQGGDPAVCDDPEKVLGVPEYSYTLRFERGGRISRVDALSIGKSVFELGAGRRVKTDAADPHAGLRLIAKGGDKVKAGDEAAVLYSSKPVKEEAISLARDAFEFDEA